MTTATASEFKNMTYLDFTNPEIREKMENAIKKVRDDFGKEYPITIDGKKLFCEQKFNSYNPGNKTEVVGVFQKADTQIAEQAMQSALKAFKSWKHMDYKKRAEYLQKAADRMIERRYELDAAMILEVGKNWIEADADTCEAIDFLNFYARQMLEYGKEIPLTPYNDESNHAFYVPLGVGAIIPPWNFPCAILTGMASGAIVAGNTIVLKPASDAPLIGYKVAEIFEEIGLPPGVLNFVTGPGSSVGNYLVEHPKTRFISFTGSKEVGPGDLRKSRQGGPWSDMAQAGHH